MSKDTREKDVTALRYLREVLDSTLVAAFKVHPDVPPGVILVMTHGLICDLMAASPAGPKGIIASTEAALLRASVQDIPESNQSGKGIN